MSSREQYLGWCTIESDPALFHTLLCDAGVKNVQVEEIYSLDETIQDCYGLIFLFRWKEEEIEEEMEESCPLGIWFANQVHDNCCASLAMLNIVLNCPQIELGDHLSSFKEFTKELTPPLRGFSMQNFEYLRKIHNAFARRSEILQNNINIVEASNLKQPKVIEEDNEQAFHFIAYVPVDGVIWELDGLKRQPVNIGKVTSDNWLSVVTPKIKDRMERYSENEVMFTLLAIVKKPLDAVLEDISRVTECILHVTRSLDCIDPLWHGASGFSRDDAELRQVPCLSSNSDGTTVKDDLMQRYHKLNSEKLALQQRLRHEQEKLETYGNHASRIKSDYSPFLRKYIRLLAEKGLMQSLM